MVFHFCIVENIKSICHNAYQGCKKRKEKRKPNLNVTVQASVLYGRLYVLHRAKDWRMSFLPCDNCWVFERWCLSGCCMPDQNGIIQFGFLSILMALFVCLFVFYRNKSHLITIPYFPFYSITIVGCQTSEGCFTTHIVKKMCYKIYLIWSLVI